LLELFSSLEYGRTPTERIAVRYEVLSENSGFLEGKATARQVRFTFSNNGKRHEAILLLVLPNASKGKVPVFVAYSFKGNHSLTSDVSILPPAVFSMSTMPDHWRFEKGDEQRGGMSSRWPLEKIVDRGYGLATMSYQDIYPDVAEKGEANGVIPLFTGYGAGESKASDRWQAIGAWAWGMSRIVDYLETEERVDPEKIAAMGHSRLGKATIWSGVQDERFKIVVSNNSGCGGAALSKRMVGEDVAAITGSFPHWFCPAFSRYAGNEAALPFDQHELIALIAPRKVYIASAQDDLWADPVGEFLGGYHAGPVYELYGLKGLGTDTQPAVHRPIMNDIGYHLRTGKHDVTDYDWECFMDFADRHFDHRP
jgi:hypothetical protein